MPGTPSTARSMSVETALEHEAHDPALAVAVVDEPAGVDQRGAVGPLERRITARPSAASISRPSKIWLSTPCWRRSAIVGNMEKSPSTAAALAMSSSLMPAHFVAQKTMLCSLEMARMFPASISVSAAEQAVAVLHEVGRFGAGHRGVGDVAGERRLDGAVLHGQGVRIAGRDAGRCAAYWKRWPGPAVAGEEVGRRERAADLERQALVLARVRRTAVTVNGGAASPSDASAASRIEIIRSADVARAGDGERPRQLQVVAPDRRRRPVRRTSRPSPAAGASTAGSSVVRPSR